MPQTKPKFDKPIFEKKVPVLNDKGYTSGFFTISLKEYKEKYFGELFRFVPEFNHKLDSSKNKAAIKTRITIPLKQISDLRNALEKLEVAYEKVLDEKDTE